MIFGRTEHLTIIGNDEKFFESATKDFDSLKEKRKM